MTRASLSLVLASTLALGAAGCNLVVGVGDYAAGTAADAAFESGAGGDDAPTSSDDASDGSATVVPEASVGADAPADAPTNAGEGGPASCSYDTLLTCPSGATGYACSGADRPDRSNTSLVCNTATGADAGSGGESTFCCFAPTCSADSTVVGCLNGWDGYSCTGSDTPQLDDSTLACQYAPAVDGTVAYCCIAATCTASAAVTGCAAGRTGYTCPGGDSPEETFANLDCTRGAANGTYCCELSTCAPASVTCTGDGPLTVGYACSGTDLPTDEFLPVTLCDGSSTAGFCCTPAPSCRNSSDCLTSTDVTTVCDLSDVCQVATGAVGDPCEDDTDCSGSETCNDIWCVSSTCTTDASCGSASTGLPNQCQPLSGGGKGCFPSCNTNADCSVYNGGFVDTFCVPGNGTYGICSGNSGDIGDPCIYDSDCTYGSCGDASTCTQSCSSASDTSCGTNSSGAQNLCVYDSALGDYECMASCASDADCVPYGGAHGSCAAVTGGKACTPPP